MSSAVECSFASQRITGILLALLAAIAFSAKTILAKLAYTEGADAVTILALRMAFSVPFFLVVAAFSGANKSSAALTKQDKWAVVGLGLIGYYLASLLDFLGLQYISANFERLILFLYPTMVVVISALLFRHRVGRTIITALVMSYGGIALVFVGDLQAMQHEMWLGSALVFASALAYSIFLVGSPALIHKIGATRFTVYVMLVSCVASVLQFVVTHTMADLQLSSRVYGLSVAMALISTVLPAFLLAEAMKRIGSSYTAMIGSAGPVSTIILAYIFLGERFSLIQAGGSILVLIGVLIVSLKR